MMNQDKRNKTIALLATALLHVALLLVLFFSFLEYKWPPDDMPIVNHDVEEIMFGGEFVMLGNVETPASKKLSATATESPTKSEEQTVPNEDTHNAGEAIDKPKDLVSTQKESPMKTQTTPDKKKGATKSEQAEQDKRVAAEEAARKKINDRMKFGNTNGKGDGKQGSPDGNNDTEGVFVGQPGLNGLTGYTIAHWEKPKHPGSKKGTVIVSVRVSARGKVTSARCTGGTISDASVRRSCEEAAQRSSFSVPTSTTAEGVGTLTYTMK